MKKFFFSAVIILSCLLAAPFSAQSASNPKHIDPCALIAREKVFAAFPALKKMEKQILGPNTTCNYLDKYGIPALIISVGQAGTTPARNTMSMLGEGYTVKDVPDLGDDAAVAVAQPNSRFGIKGGVAELHIKKGGSALLLAPARIEVQENGPKFKKLKSLAAEMLKKLP